MSVLRGVLIIIIAVDTQRVDILQDSSGYLLTHLLTTDESKRQMLSDLIAVGEVDRRDLPSAS